MFLSSLYDNLENIEQNFLQNIDSLFDAYFLISNEDIVLNYNINDKTLKSYFRGKKLCKENFYSLFRHLRHQNNLDILKTKIFEEKPSKFEFIINYNDKLNYYNIFVFIFSKNQKLITFQDTTKQKETEFDLIEESNTLKNIIELNPYGIEIKDAEGHHISANQAFIDMFKSVPPPEYSIFEDPHVKKRGLLDKILTLKEGKVLKMGEHWYDPRDSVLEANFDINLEDYPSSLICHKGVVFPIFERGGKKIKKYVFMHENITRQKLAEIALEDLRKDLEKRVKERTIQLGNSAMKYNFAYNRVNCFKGLFMHDISNIIETIGNSIELCKILTKNSEIEKDIPEHFQFIDQQMKRGKQLINNIRNNSEIEETEMPLEPIEIFKKLKSAIQFARLNYPNDEIQVKISNEFNEICVIGNELLVDSFENILINSIRYNKSKIKKIEIAISRIKEKNIPFVKIEFRDNGTGINDIKKKLIFREKDKKEIGSKGMGLGLSLVAKLIDLYNGKIWVEDRVKGDFTKGSNFIIQIPEAI
jgi:signal transduction histidine kinase